MQSDDTRGKLINATKALLLEEENPEKITARQIAGKADVNLAMINYCFASKDELLKIAVDEIIRSEFEKSSVEESGSGTPKDKLKRILFHISEVTLRYNRLTRLSVPYALLNAPIEIPDNILPYIKAYFRNKEESYCKMIAYEIVSFLQIVFYRVDDFYKFSGMNLQEKEELRAFIDTQIEIMLGGDTDEK